MRCCLCKTPSQFGYCTWCRAFCLVVSDDECGTARIQRCAAQRRDALAGVWIVIHDVVKRLIARFRLCIASRRMEHPAHNEGRRILRWDHPALFPQGWHAGMDVEAV